MAKEHVQGIIDFFKGEFWNDFVENDLVHKDEVVYHAHIYLETNVHPESLHPIMYAYWEAKGKPINRAIDPMSPKTHVAALHGVQPEGLPAFDFFIKYSKDHVLAPMKADDPLAEEGHNKLSWGKNYQDEFVKQFDFKVVGPQEDEEIRKYFKSKHWKEVKDHVMDPNIMHCHANYEISFDPKIMEMFAREELGKMGWVIDTVYPCVYNVRGQYTGKNVFFLRHPEKVFDMTWRFNPDVVMKPSDAEWIFGDDRGFDIWRRPLYDAVLEENEFYHLTDDEIKEVIDSFK